MKQSHSVYRERIAKIRYYLGQLGGAEDNADVLKYTALITYELNRMPYAPPKPKKGFFGAPQQFHQMTPRDLKLLTASHNLLGRARMSSKLGAHRRALYQGIAALRLLRWMLSQ